MMKGRLENVPLRFTTRPGCWRKEHEVRLKNDVSEDVNRLAQEVSPGHMNHMFAGLLPKEPLTAPDALYVLRKVVEHKGNEELSRVAQEATYNILLAIVEATTNGFQTKDSRKLLDGALDAIRSKARIEDANPLSDGIFGVGNKNEVLEMEVKPREQKVVPKNDMNSGARTYTEYNPFGERSGRAKLEDMMDHRGNGKVPEASEKPKDFQDMSKTEPLRHDGGDKHD